MGPSHEVTSLLKRWRDGDTAAFDEAIPLVYSELHRRAHAYMSRERPDRALQTTDLVHEAYLRLVHAGDVDWKGRLHFFAISANVMRRILVEFARSRACVKRGGGSPAIPLDDALSVSPEPDRDLVALDDALNALAAIDPRQAKIVELRFFSGMTVDETATELGISPDTVLRDWTHAKAWLIREIVRGNQHEN